MEEAEVPMSELVESGEDVSVVLDLADEALHRMTLSVQYRYSSYECGFLRFERGGITAMAPLPMIDSRN